MFKIFQKKQKGVIEKAHFSIRNIQMRYGNIDEMGKQLNISKKTILGWKQEIKKTNEEILIKKLLQMYSLHPEVINKKTMEEIESVALRVEYCFIVYVPLIDTISHLNYLEITYLLREIGADKSQYYKKIKSERPGFIKCEATFETLKHYGLVDKNGLPNLID